MNPEQFLILVPYLPIEKTLRDFINLAIDCLSKNNWQYDFFFHKALLNHMNLQLEPKPSSIQYILYKNHKFQMHLNIYTSENQNTEFFKCDLFWRIVIFYNSELFLVHLKTDKSHTFIMYLNIFCVSLSLRELSELRGVQWLKSIFMKNLEWNPWNLKEPTRSSKAKITFFCR